MKTKLLLLSIFISSICVGQINEQRAIKESHIDFTKEYIFFTIHGLIEIDGHTFKNDTCRCPIQFQANLDGVAIIDTCSKEKYEHRNCKTKGCKVIHLIKRCIINEPYPYPEWWSPMQKLHLALPTVKW